MIENGLKNNILLRLAKRIFGINRDSCFELKGYRVRTVTKDKTFSDFSYGAMDPQKFLICDECKSVWEETINNKFILDRKGNGVCCTVRDIKNFHSKFKKKR